MLAVTMPVSHAGAFFMDRFVRLTYHAIDAMVGLSPGRNRPDAAEVDGVTDG